jgi:hypothetical protein
MSNNAVVNRLQGHYKLQYLFCGALCNGCKIKKWAVPLNCTLRKQLTGVGTIDIESLQNRLLKVCYVPATSDSLNRLLFFFFHCGN